MPACTCGNSITTRCATPPSHALLDAQIDCASDAWPASADRLEAGFGIGTGDTARPRRLGEVINFKLL
jgi:hypothetical protein